MSGPTADVRLLGRPDALDRVAFVTMPGAELEDIRVRFRPAGPKAWRCEACGRFPGPDDCPHARAVAAALARERTPHTPARRRGDHREGALSPHAARP